MRAHAVDHLVLRTDRDATADLVGWIARRPRRLAHLRRQHALGAGTRRSVMRFLVEWRLFLLVGVGALAGAWVAAPCGAAGTSCGSPTSSCSTSSPRPIRAGGGTSPAVLFLVALAALVVGFAQPVRASSVGDERATVILAIDTSLSMEADDVAPEPPRGRPGGRPRVRGRPARPSSTSAWSRSTAPPPWPSPPTRDRDALTAAIDAVELGEGTAIGEAVFTSLDVVEPAPRGDDGEAGARPHRASCPTARPPGRPDAEAAAAAADAGVPVDTIAFGTAEGTIEGEHGGTEPVPGRCPSRWPRSPSTTGGTAFEADSLGELSSAYADIGGVVGYDEVDRDVSGWFVGGGIALLALAGSLSLAWSQRLP